MLGHLDQALAYIQITCRCWQSPNKETATSCDELCPELAESRHQITGSILAFRNQYFTFLASFLSAQGYPLRPELIESTYLLHAATGDGTYLEAGRLFQATLAERNQQKCGFASVADVATGARFLHGSHLHRSHSQEALRTLCLEPLGHSGHSVAYPKAPSRKQKLSSQCSFGKQLQACGGPDLPRHCLDV